MSDFVRLEQIGHELFDLHVSGELTLQKFQELFLAAEQACGTDRDARDHLEMFSPLAEDPSWMEWLREHSRRRRRLHVA
jgi:hypothetical protein